MKSGKWKSKGIKSTAPDGQYWPQYRQLKHDEIPSREGLALYRARCLAELFGHTVDYGWPVAWCNERCFMYKPPPDGVVSAEFLSAQGEDFPFNVEVVDPGIGVEMLAINSINRYHLWEPSRCDPRVRIASHVHRSSDRRCDPCDFVFAPRHQHSSKTTRHHRNT